MRAWVTASRWCALCSRAGGSYSVVCVMWGLPAGRCSVLCSFWFRARCVSSLGSRAIHLPAFAFALFIVEYDFNACERARFFCEFDPFNYTTILLDDHHGSCFRFFASGSLSAGDVAAVSCGRICCVLW